MSHRGITEPALKKLRGSGLESDDGGEFLRARIALFAKIITVMASGFYVLGFVALAIGGLPPLAAFFDVGAWALLAGAAFAGVMWLICGKVPLSRGALSTLDAVVMIGCCTAWSFFIEPLGFEGVHTAMMATLLTVVCRAIIVPAKAMRTLRVSLVAMIPPLVMTTRWAMAKAIPDELPHPGHSRMVLFYQVLWAIDAVATATITSRVIYGLRKSVREANELGSYTLERRIGAGGMGEVWRARHRFLARAAAVKLIRRDPLLSSRSDPETLLRRFEREARATAALRSPHTVQLYDFGQADDGTLYYVMEMLEGVDLDTLVSRFGPVPAERAIHILKQVCRSLQEAHENDLVHRDVKPANIFVSGVGTELDFAKVLDFGLVRLGHGLRSDDLKLTGDGAASGTPAYMAPEIVLGEETYDHRVDLYAVGCVAYWLVTGKLVFENDTAMKVMLDHARTPAPPPRTRTELPIPVELEQIIMDCLEKDPARRPASAAVLAQRLGAVTPAHEWTAERAERWWRSHMPEQVQARSVADVLLSHEAAPGTVRELRPRRHGGAS